MCAGFQAEYPPDPDTKERIDVGTIIVRDVPTQSCMRTSSGTPNKRKISYKIGTMIAPPPIPKRPARVPVIRPPSTIAAMRRAKSANGTPGRLNSFRPAETEKILHGSAHLMKNLIGSIVFVALRHFVRPSLTEMTGRNCTPCPRG